MGWDYKAGVLSCQNAADRKARRRFRTIPSAPTCANGRSVVHYLYITIGIALGAMPAFLSTIKPASGLVPGLAFVVFQRFADGFIGQLPVR